MILVSGAGTGGTCDSGIYAYFTAGYVNTRGKWNEMNFGFHPDRDNHGTEVSCEHHDDSGGYHETSVKLGFNCAWWCAWWHTSCHASMIASGRGGRKAPLAPGT
jgi:hypothetical protein